MNRSFAAIAILLAVLPLLLLAYACGGSPLQPQTLLPQCSAELWNHVYDPSRLQVINPCTTVTGVVMEQHTSGDGDVNSDVALDAPYASLVNDVNVSRLQGRLHVEEVCQGRITRDAFDACRDFTGSVLVPPAGAHVSVTGSYVRDSNHGWMEIHPASNITVIP